MGEIRFLFVVFRLPCFLFFSFSKMIKDEYLRVRNYVYYIYAVTQRKILHSFRFV